MSEITRKTARGMRDLAKIMRKLNEQKITYEPELITRLRKDCPGVIDRLSDDQLVRLYQLLLDDCRVTNLETVMRKEWGISRDQPWRKIEKEIMKFRDMHCKSPYIPTHEQLFYVKELDALQRLRWVIEEQTKRVATQIEREREKGRSSKSTRENIALLENMCKDALNLEMSMGLRNQTPQELLIEHKLCLDQLIGKLEDRGQQFQVSASKFLIEAEKQAVTLEVDDDGNYELRPTTAQEKSATLPLGIAGGLGLSTRTFDEDEQEDLG